MEQQSFKSVHPYKFPVSGVWAFYLGTLVLNLPNQYWQKTWMYVQATFFCNSLNIYLCIFSLSAKTLAQTGRDLCILEKKRLITASFLSSLESQAWLWDGWSLILRFSMNGQTSWEPISEFKPAICIWSSHQPPPPCVKILFVHLFFSPSRT